jgi:iron complex outermembrane recepter protein
MPAIQIKCIRAALLGSACPLLFAVPVEAQAHEATPRAEEAGQAGSSAPAAGDVSEIIVTAQRRSGRLIDAPQSVSVLSGNDLARLGATQLSEFADAVPALQFSTQGVGKSTVSLRGVTTGNDVGQTVGIYVDEVPYGSSSSFAKAALLALDVGLFDLDRIEVLRGPQGTLYGASSMGGVLKYVTRAPSLTELGGSLQAGVSDTRFGGMGYNGSAVINVPIAADRAAVRASGFYSREGGYIDNIGTGRENVDAGQIYGGRADLLLKPTEALSIRITGFVQNIRRDGSLYSDYDFSGSPVNGALEQNHPLREPFASNFRLASGTITYDLGAATLTSVTSYQSSRSTFAQDLSVAYVPLLSFFGISSEAVGYAETDRTKKFTQEVRLASRSNHSLEWLVGAFYTHERSSSAQGSSVFGANLTPLPIDLATLRIPSTYQEYAVFGDITYYVSDRFDVSGGLRFARNNQTVEQIASGLLVSSAPKAKSRESVVTYLANARYRFSKHVAAYARFATGYRPGGPNLLALNVVTGEPLFAPTFKSDTLASYELGLKGETLDRSFGIDAAAYYIDWADIPVIAAIQGRTGFVNARGAQIKGAEVALTARPIPTLTFLGTFAYNDATLSDANADLGAGKGERLPNVPHFTATAGVDYVVRNIKIRPSLGASLRYVSDRRVSFDHSNGSPQYRLPSYAVVDLRAGATLGAVDVQLYVRNLLDKRAQLSGVTYLSSFGGPAQVTIAQPRTIGLNLTMRF